LLAGLADINAARQAFGTLRAIQSSGDVLGHFSECDRRQSVEFRAQSIRVIL
jgi:hypothetical protein